MEIDKLTIDDVCLYINISKFQRKTELERGLDETGTAGFKDKGCYDCDGYNTSCETYTTKKTITGGYFT